jgi:Caspase domain
MAETLSGLGFDVTLAIDVDGRAMSRVVRKFGKKLRAAGDDTVGLFFYAGHGVSARGTNYLIPLGAEIESESDLELESMSASSILAQMMDARNALNLVILDACRNNPYKGAVRSIANGLTRVTTASGALIAFSAAPGQVAVDGNGANSPYTTALVKAMQVPGIAIEQVFKKVRVSVENTTGGVQSPWEESSLRGDFYFVPGTAPQASSQVYLPQVSRPQVTQPQIFQPQVAQPQVSQPQVFRSPVNSNTALQTEALFWKSVKDSRDPNTFAAYLETYPNGTFAGLARVLMNNLIREAKPENTAKRQQLASLQPPNTEKAPVARKPQYSLRERTLILQRELKRVGCDPGRVDGRWGPKGRRALSRFKRYARLDLDFDDLSDEVIDAVKQQRSNLCPAIVRAQRREAQPVESSENVVKAKPNPPRTYGVQNRTKREWQDCVIESITPSPTTSGADC